MADAVVDFKLILFLVVVFSTILLGVWSFAASRLTRRCPLT